jgi:hypothetical protein
MACYVFIVVFLEKREVVTAKVTCFPACGIVDSQMPLNEDKEVRASIVPLFLSVKSNLVRF